MAEVIKTAPVAGAAYLKTHAGPMHTHAIAVENGQMLRVLCRRVKFENILDDSALWTDELPTCPACRKRVKTVK